MKDANAGYLKGVEADWYLQSQVDAIAAARQVVLKIGSTGSYQQRAQADALSLFLLELSNATIEGAIDSAGSFIRSSSDRLIALGLTKAEVETVAQGAERVSARIGIAASTIGVLLNVFLEKQGGASTQEAVISTLKSTAINETIALLGAKLLCTGATDGLGVFACNTAVNLAGPIIQDLGSRGFLGGTAPYGTVYDGYCDTDDDVLYQNAVPLCGNQVSVGGNAIDPLTGKSYASER